MRIFFSVGEPSGDLHASNLIREIRTRDPELDAVGFAGPKMQAAGCESLFDLTQLAVMFLAGAIRNYLLFMKLVGRADDYFSKNHVDAVVLIDYPGFNWWIARKAKKHNIPVFYYGVPQMWAWASWRIKKIRRFVDRVICKLPFEPAWFSERGCPAYYVGHPYFDQLTQQRLDDDFMGSISDDSRPLVLLLPGSRKFELENNLQTLVSSAKKIRSKVPTVRLAIGSLNEEHARICRPLCESNEIEVYVDKTQELMSASTACIACSGSVCLELLYHRVPTVIVYKIGWWKLLMQMFVLKCKFITLTNLMNTKEMRKTTWLPFDPDAPDAEPVLMPEYLSVSEKSTQVSQRIVQWLQSSIVRESKRAELDKLAIQYAIPGATSRAANYIIRELKNGVQSRSAAA